MRDIRGELQDRAYMVQHQIKAERAQFETLISQLKTEQDRRLESLKAQLRTVNKLIDVAAWQYNVRAALTLSTAVAAAAETSAAATVIKRPPADEKTITKELTGTVQTKAGQRVSS